MAETQNASSIESIDISNSQLDLINVLRAKQLAAGRQILHFFNVASVSSASIAPYLIDAYKQSPVVSLVSTTAMSGLLIGAIDRGKNYRNRAKRLNEASQTMDAIRETIGENIDIFTSDYDESESSLAWQVAEGDNPDAERVQKLAVVSELLGVDDIWLPARIAKSSQKARSLYDLVSAVKEDPVEETPGDSELYVTISRQELSDLAHKLEQLRRLDADMYAQIISLYGKKQLAEDIEELSSNIDDPSARAAMVCKLRDVLQDALSDTQRERINRTGPAGISHTTSRISGSTVYQHRSTQIGGEQIDAIFDEHEMVTDPIETEQKLHAALESGMISHEIYVLALKSIYLKLMSYDIEDHTDQSKATEHGLSEQSTRAKTLQTSVLEQASEHKPLAKQIVTRLAAITAIAATVYVGDAYEQHHSPTYSQLDHEMSYLEYVNHTGDPTGVAAVPLHYADTAIDEARQAVDLPFLDDESVSLSTSMFGDSSGSQTRTFGSIETHNGASTLGYWGTQPHNFVSFWPERDELGSFSVDWTEATEMVALPTELPEAYADQPNIKVELTVRAGDPLPVLEGTKIVASTQIYDVESVSVNPGLEFNSSTGVWSTRSFLTDFEQMRSSSVDVTYWLAQSDDATLSATSPVEWDTVRTDYSSEVVGLEVSQADMSAHDVLDDIKRKHYSYTPIDSVFHDAESQQNVYESLKASHDANCNTAALEYLLATGGISPDGDFVNPVKGFLIKEPNASEFSQPGHMWLVDESGDYYDPTPHASTSFSDERIADTLPYVAGGASILLALWGLGGTIRRRYSEDKLGLVNFATGVERQALYERPGQKPPAAVSNTGTISRRSYNGAPRGPVERYKHAAERVKLNPLQKLKLAGGIAVDSYVARASARK